MSDLTIFRKPNCRLEISISGLNIGKLQLLMTQLVITEASDQRSEFISYCFEYLAVEANKNV